MTWPQAEQAFVIAVTALPDLFRRYFTKENTPTNTIAAISPMHRRIMTIKDAVSS
jgi:hypothetical protein